MTIDVKLISSEGGMNHTMNHESSEKSRSNYGFESVNPHPVLESQMLPTTQLDEGRKGGRKEERKE